MKPTTSRIAFLLSGIVLSVFVLGLAALKPRYCNAPDAAPPTASASASANAPVPTLAPPLKVVVVQVEADKSDIEISWADN